MEKVTFKYLIVWMFIFVLGIFLGLLVMSYSGADGPLGTKAFMNVVVLGTGWLVASGILARVIDIQTDDEESDDNGKD